MWPPAEFLIHTLSSAGVPSTARCPSCPASESHSFGVDHVCEFFGLAIELGDRALVHQADPGIVVLVDFKIERAERIAGLDHRDRILRDLPGLRIHFAEEHLAEIRVPDVAFVIEHDVVRLDQLVRHVVFGDDDVSGFAGQARQRLERPAPGVLRAEIDAGEPLGGLLRLPAGNEPAHRVAGKPLRLAMACCPDSNRPCAGTPAELGRVVGRSHDALQRVAAVAIEHESLLIVGARHAR